MTFLDQGLFWTIVGSVAGVIGILPLIWRLFRANGPAPDIHVGYFPHASLPLALELSNLSAVGVDVRNVLVSSDIVAGSPKELYPVSAALLPRERRLIPVYPEARKYFDTHMKALYQTGRESRKPAMKIAFKCEASGKKFDTSAILLEGRLSNGIVVDLRPP
jgi:hypothetical protein